MRRFWVVMLFVLIGCVSVKSSYAQSADDIVKCFKNCKNAEYHKLSGAVLSVLRVVLPNDTAIFDKLTEEDWQKILKDKKMSKEEFLQASSLLIDFVNHTKSMTILSLDECSDADKKVFASTMASWVPSGFTAAEKEEGVFVKMNGEIINEIIVVNYSDDDYSLMMMKGELTPEFIAHAEENMKQIIEKME